MNNNDLAPVTSVEPFPAHEMGVTDAGGRGGLAVLGSGGVIVLLALAAMAVVIPTAVGQPLISIGLLYAVGYMMLAWFRPEIALMLIYASAPLQSDLSGGGLGAKFSLTEINMALATPVFVIKGILTRRTVFNLGPLTIPVTLYFVCCAISCVHNWLGNFATISLIQEFNYLVISVCMFAHFVYNREKNKISFYALSWMGIFCAFYKFAGLGFLHLNKNGLGASLSCALMASVELWLSSAGDARQQRRLAIMIGVMTLALVATVSRGAWMSTAVGLGILLGMRRQFLLLLRLSLILVPLIAVAWFVMPQSDREYATGLDATRYNIKIRLNDFQFYEKHWDKNQLIGDGVGLGKMGDPTNTPLLILAETGIFGLIAFVLIHVSFVRMVWVTQKYLDRRDPMYSFLAIGAAMVFGKLAHGMVDHYWSRGAVSMAWASAGMALGVYFDVKRRRKLLADSQAPLYLRNKF